MGELHFWEFKSSVGIGGFRSTSFAVRKWRFECRRMRVDFNLDKMYKHETNVKKGRKEVIFAEQTVLEMYANSYEIDIIDLNLFGEQHLLLLLLGWRSSWNADWLWMRSAPLVLCQLIQEVMFKNGRYDERELNPIVVADTHPWLPLWKRLKQPSVVGNNPSNKRQKGRQKVACKARQHLFGFWPLGPLDLMTVALQLRSGMCYCGAVVFNSKDTIVMIIW